MFLIRRLPANPLEVKRKSNEHGLHFQLDLEKSMLE
jgi:hypothetical protein